MRVYIGYDSHETAAYAVAMDSLRRLSPTVPITTLDHERLRRSGLLTRTVYRDNNRRFDAASEAPVSTEFAISRFITPILAQSGYALFTDCDVVFMRDVEDIMQHVDGSKAVYVVKHNHKPSTVTKMGGHFQTTYDRKNWSSVMLFDCDHPANSRLTLFDLNNRTGRDLHQFYWLADEEIGELPSEWNWLVGEQPKPDYPAIAHFTLGGPWINGWKPREHDELWERAFARVGT